ncbi:hypothetical protein H0G86_005345 [Trichoderma simmonsii]|uniref:Protein pob1 n=1 Tax=Trichoderma simmonsii TaxID=1491479 RepID=A0A8G0LE46_9HYPO|nr:hypothetical protein H0G86_005345 [Trichoderma simmonsii]
MDYNSFHVGESRTYQEMRQKPAPQNTFFNLKQEPQQFRPTSVATEFVDTDWDEEDDEDEVSEAEDNSPRVSLQSSGQPSITTLSSYDEVPTPRSSRVPQFYLEYSPKQVEGPRGPHLFQFPADQYSRYQAGEDDAVLTLSPMTPAVPREVVSHARASRWNGPFQYTNADLDPSTLASWTPEMVAQSMLDAGIELAITERFIENDINGAILITLKFEDLKELSISSFGIRTRVWHQIQTLMDSRPTSPQATTPIEDRPSREARKVMKKDSSGSTRRHESKRRVRRATDPITPMESVSIIGIEQVIPKPHNCSKGEKCSKWKKQQKIIEEFKAMNPHIDINKASGAVLVYGDAGNPDTARALDPNETFRPFSDSVPSVVASSDILGPGGLPPLQYLQETTLRNMQMRDPQDNVRQFLNFQRSNPGSNEVPPTPPFEVTPSAQPHQGLRRLPKLSIPGNSQPAARQAPPRPPVSQSVQQQQQQQASRRSSPLQQEFVPYQMDKADPLSPDLETAKNPYRFGTPFSEMDVPITAVPLGPVARDASQSVPPDMNYRAAPTVGHNRSQSRASGRRPSFPVLPALDENRATRTYQRAPEPRSASPRTPVRPHQQQQPQQQSQPTQAPPRFNYPWSPVDRTTYEQAIPPMPSMGPGVSKEAPEAAPANGVSFQGPMKKRKVRLLRHEWQDGYFTLKGTRLNMHKDAQQVDRTLEYVDIDDYAIACSSLASTSKLSAAFKAVSISHNRDKSDPVGAFSFQLIPQDKNGARLRKRDSSLQPNASTEGVNGTGKTHHFAVKNRDERIDWMRELMLAKALKQKGDGFEISVNGNMI